MPKKLAKSELIARCHKVHNNKYDYSLANYVNFDTHMMIICPIHGQFTQNPNTHILKQCGCPQCANIEKLMTQEVFIKRVRQIHGSLYDLTNTKYQDAHTKVLMKCKIHGEFSIYPHNLFSKGAGCHQCGIKQPFTTQEFISRAIKVHGDNYEYSLVKYIDCDTKINVICKEHGSFFPSPNNHVNAESGCPECGKHKQSSGGYSLSFFENFPDIAKQPAILYVIHMTHKTDNFIKVGITKRTIQERFYKVGHITKEILLTKNMSLLDAFVLEQNILKELKDFQYWPNYVFDGRTECLKNTPEVIHQINQLIM